MNSLRRAETGKSGDEVSDWLKAERQVDFAEAAKKDKWTQEIHATAIWAIHLATGLPAHEVCDKTPVPKNNAQRWLVYSGIVAALANRPLDPNSREDGCAFNFRELVQEVVWHYPWVPYAIM